MPTNFPLTVEPKDGLEKLKNLDLNSNSNRFMSLRNESERISNHTLRRGQHNSRGSLAISAMMRFKSYRHASTDLHCDVRVNLRMQNP